MVLGFLFGWDRKVRKLRKKWDRSREKTLKKDGSLRSELLSRLDQIENHLRLLEERRLSRVDRARFAKEIEIALAEINEMLKMKPEEFRERSGEHIQ